jgi:hypothetical protein
MCSQKPSSYCCNIFASTTFFKFVALHLHIYECLSSCFSVYYLNDVSVCLDKQPCLSVVSVYLHLQPCLSVVSVYLHLQHILSVVSVYIHLQHRLSVV